MKATLIWGIAVVAFLSIGSLAIAQTVYSGNIAPQSNVDSFSSSQSTFEFDLTAGSVSVSIQGAAASATVVHSYLGRRISGPNNGGSATDTCTGAVTSTGNTITGTVADGTRGLATLSLTRISATAYSGTVRLQSKWYIGLETSTQEGPFWTDFTTNVTITGPPAGTPLLSPGDRIIAVDSDQVGSSVGSNPEPPSNSSYPASESPAKAIDRTAAKYLNFGKRGAGFVVTAAGPCRVEAVQLTTANDATERDPMSYSIYGTNDPITSADNSTGNAENWTYLGGGSLNTPAERGASIVSALSNTQVFRSYKWEATSLRNINSANSVQFSEIQFYGAFVTQASISVSPSSADLGDVAVGNTVTRNLTVTNTGNAPLVISGVSKGGSGAAAFGGTYPNQVAPGGTGTIVVRFNPQQLGDYYASFSISSNDPNQPVFEVQMFGRGVVPDIAVEYPEGVYAQNVPNGSTVDLGITDVYGNSSAKNFRVNNVGNINLWLNDVGRRTLNGADVRLTGADASHFRFLWTEEGSPMDSPSFLGQGEHRTLTVFFQPTLDGDKTANLEIRSNDPDENPFIIHLEATAVGQPRIRVENPPSTLGGTRSLLFGHVLVGTQSSAKTIKIKNEGTSNLIIDEIRLEGLNPDDFEMTGPPGGVLPAAAVDPDAYIEVSLRFRPLTKGAKLATVVIVNNDFPEEYTVDLYGDGDAFPEIVLRPAGDTDFGALNLGDSATRLYSIENIGNDHLVNLSAGVNGPDYADFTVSGIIPYSLPPGGRVNFSITFSPRDVGDREAVLLVASSDADESLLMSDLLGKGVSGGVPGIKVLRPPSTQLATSDTVNFNSVAVGTGGFAEGLILQNTGNVNLSLFSIGVGGDEAADFLVSDVSTTDLIPGEARNFNITFFPRAVGARNAWLRLTSNDPSLSVFDILLHGEGIVPPVAVDIPTMHLNEAARLQAYYTSLGQPLVASSFYYKSMASYYYELHLQLGDPATAWLKYHSTLGKSLKYLYLSKKKPKLAKYFENFNLAQGYKKYHTLKGNKRLAKVFYDRYMKIARASR